MLVNAKHVFRVLFTSYALSLIKSVYGCIFKTVCNSRKTWECEREREKQTHFQLYHRHFFHLVGNKTAACVNGSIGVVKIFEITNWPFIWDITHSRCKLSMHCGIVFTHVLLDTICTCSRISVFGAR